MKKVTQELARAVVETGWNDLPPAVIHESKRMLLDALGCALVGSTADKGRISIQYARQLGGAPESSILGARHRVACANAAFANGELINAMDYDSVIGFGHISPFVIPAALALAERGGLSGKQLILAIALGHEVAIRVVRALSTARRIVADGPDRGKMIRPAVHGMSAVIFGGTAAAAKVLDLDAGRTAHAVGITGHICPVPATTKWGHTVPSAMSKYCSAGWISQAAVSAVLLADIGYTGDTSILDGEHGFWKFFCSEEWKPLALLDQFGEQWCMLQTSYKPYPCCRAFHPALDCFVRIMDDNGLKADEIEKVSCVLDPMLEEPVWRDNVIETQVDTQFSLAHVIAAAAHKLRNTDWQKKQLIHDPKMVAFRKKVSYTTHPEQEFGKAILDNPTARRAIVEVRARGTSFRLETGYAKGAYAPDAFRWSDADVANKFRENARTLLSADNADRLAALIWEIDRVGDLSSALKPILEGLGEPVAEAA